MSYYQFSQRSNIINELDKLIQENERLYSRLTQMLKENTELRDKLTQAVAEKESISKQLELLNNKDQGSKLTIKEEGQSWILSE